MLFGEFATDACYWASLTAGTFFGVFLCLGAGFSKVVPSHPLYQRMEQGFVAFGCFYGLEPPYHSNFRVCVGIVEIFAGGCLVVGLWLSLASTVLYQQAPAVLDALILADSVAVCCMSIAIVHIHYGLQLDFPSSMTSCWVFTAARFIATPLSRLPPDCQQLVQLIGGASGCMLIASVIVHLRCGTTAEKTKSDGRGEELCSCLAAESAHVVVETVDPTLADRA